MTTETPFTRKQQVEEITSQTLAAMARRKGLRAQFSAPATGIAHPVQSMGDDPQVNLPNLTTKLDAKEQAITRGAADAAALWLKHHDARNHRRHRPQDAQAAEIFDAMELARVESLGAKEMAGVAENIAQRTRQRCLLAGYHSLLNDAEPPMPELMGLLLREKIAHQPVPEALQPLLNACRQRLTADSEALWQQLQQHASQPEAFAQATLQLLRHLKFLPPLPPEGTFQPDSSPEDTPLPMQATAESSEPQPEDEDATETVESTSTEGGEPAPESMSPDDDSASQQDDLPDAPPMPDYFTPNSDHPLFQYQAQHYHVFTTEFDEEIRADMLATPEELQQLRTKLDFKLKQYRALVGKLASRLQRLLLARQQRSWYYEQEEGLIDAARLSRMVTHPDYRHFYKIESEAPFRDTVVTLLIDNSGSMRGRPISIAATCADILARTLERCGVKVEVLGFTTREWKGGQSRKLWLQRGSPLMDSRGTLCTPGRLNDVRHIVYKAANTPWRRARDAFALMLKDSILKENIDGEAVLWAHQRLLRRPESRKILMVISDGAPVDDSTLSVNHPAYLDSHLREVIREIETRSPVELTAIGIGHDVTRYYQRAVTIANADKLADTLLGELTRLFQES